MYKVYFKKAKYVVYFETIREARLHAEATGWDYTMFFGGREIEQYKVGTSGERPVH